MNYEHAYLVVKFLHILFSHFAFSKKARKKQKNFVERVAVCRVLVDYNICIAKQGIKEAAVPNIPSRKTSLWYNVNDKEKTFIIPIFIPNKVFILSNQ